MKSRWITAFLAPLALGAPSLPLASQVSYEATTVEPVDLGTKPVLRTLRAGQAPRELPTVSPEAFARWESAQDKTATRLLRAERASRASKVGIEVAPTAVAQCLRMKAVMWTLNRCGEERPEVGAASGRP